jgi:hypothetical protein
LFKNQLNYNRGLYEVIARFLFRSLVLICPLYVGYSLLIGDEIGIYGDQLVFCLILFLYSVHVYALATMECESPPEPKTQKEGGSSLINDFFLILYGFLTGFRTIFSIAIDCVYSVLYHLTTSFLFVYSLFQKKKSDLNEKTKEKLKESKLRVTDKLNKISTLDASKVDLPDVSYVGSLFLWLSNFHCFYYFLVLLPLEMQNYKKKLDLVVETPIYMRSDVINATIKKGIFVLFLGLAFQIVMKIINWGASKTKNPDVIRSIISLVFTISVPLIFFVFYCLFLYDFGYLTYLLVLYDFINFEFRLTYYKTVIQQPMSTKFKQTLKPSNNLCDIILGALGFYITEWFSGSAIKILGLVILIAWNLSILHYLYKLNPYYGKKKLEQYMINDFFAYYNSSSKSQGSTSQETEVDQKAEPFVVVTQNEDLTQDLSEK